MEHNIVGKVGQAAANGGSEANGSAVARRAECGNCGGVWRVEELRGYRDFWSRVEPGQEIPAGDCPECGAFAYLVKKPAKPLRVVVTVRGGVVQHVAKPRGAVVVVRDYDSCAVCGGVRCDGGFRAEEVHGLRMMRPGLRFKNLSGGGVVVCDGQTHTFSRMKSAPDSERTFVGTAPCLCRSAACEAPARWQEVGE